MATLNVMKMEHRLYFGMKSGYQFVDITSGTMTKGPNYSAGKWAMLLERNQEDTRAKRMTWIPLKLENAILETHGKRVVEDVTTTKKVELAIFMASQNATKVNK